MTRSALDIPREGNRIAILALMLLALAGHALRATASLPPGAITGRVLDSKEQPISGATIHLTGPDVDRTFIAGRDGKYFFALLEPGRYNVTATASNVGDVTRSEIDVDLARVTEIDIVLSRPADESATETRETALLDSRSFADVVRFTPDELRAIPGDGHLDVWPGRTGGLPSRFDPLSMTTTNDGIGLPIWGRQPGLDLHGDLLQEVAIAGSAFDPESGTPAALDVATGRGDDNWSGTAGGSLAWHRDPADRRGQADLFAALGGPLVAGRMWLWGAAETRETPQLQDRTRAQTAAIRLDAALDPTIALTAFGGGWKENDPGWRNGSLGALATWSVSHSLQIAASASRSSQRAEQTAAETRGSLSSSWYFGGPASLELRGGAGTGELHGSPGNGAFLSARRDGSAYASLTGTTGRLSFEGGARIDDAVGTVETSQADRRELQWSTISPRLAVAFLLPTERRTLLRLTYARWVTPLDPALTLPEADDVATDLGPEATRETAVSIEQELIPELTFGARFSRRSEDDGLENQTGDDGLAKIVNSAQRSRAYVGELFARKRLSNSFFVRAVVTRVHSETGATLSIPAPFWSYSFDGFVQLPSDFELTVSTVGHQRGPGENNFVTFDTRVAKRLMLGRVSTRGFVDAQNLANRPEYESGFQTGGRTFRLGFDVDF